MKEVSSLNGTENHDSSAAPEKNRIIGGTLYLVATPIGNMADISARAVKVLGGVDFIAAEDTRNTGRLLAAIGVSKPLISYFEHNKHERGERIAARLCAGESCALVTDAGMPAVSDPGADLVALCVERSIPVTCVPGACAAVDALALSGLPTGRFAFEGFLPVNKAERRERLCELTHERRTIILYEAPHKLKNTLSDLLDSLGDRRISLCRELTKLNEEIIRCTVSQACALYEKTAPRGEYVLVVGGFDGAEEQKNDWWAQLSIEEHVARYTDEDGMTKNDAIRKAAHDRGVSRNSVYRLMLNDNSGK